MLDFLAEIPRTFLRVEGNDKDEALVNVNKEMEQVVKNFAIIEDVTGKSFPSSKDAMMARDASLLNKVVSIPETSRNITKATNGRAFLGPWGADIIMNESLVKSIPLELPETYQVTSQCSIQALMDVFVKEDQKKAQ